MDSDSGQSYSRLASHHVFQPTLSTTSRVLCQFPGAMRLSMAPPLFSSPPPSQEEPCTSCDIPMFCVLQRLKLMWMPRRFPGSSLGEGGESMLCAGQAVTAVAGLAAQIPAMLLLLLESSSRKTASDSTRSRKSGGRGASAACPSITASVAPRATARSGAQREGAGKDRSAPAPDVMFPSLSCARLSASSPVTLAGRTQARRVLCSYRRHHQPFPVTARLARCSAILQHTSSA